MVYALMEIQNIVQTLLTMAAINGRKINKMDEIRLIDVNDVYEIIGQTGVARVHVADIDPIKRIDPETLPIVRELREKLERVTAQRDELFKMLNDVCKDTREQHVDESVCGLCEYDVAYIGQSGDWVNECPGFNSDDCFCMKRSIREKFGQLENMSLYGPDGDHP